MADKTPLVLAADQAVTVAEQVDRILEAFRPASTIPLQEVDDDDRAYVAAQFDEIVDLIEALPRTFRVFMGREMATRDRASLIEIAGLLAAMGARFAPQPKDAA